MMQQPCQRRAMPPRNLIERPAGLSEFTGSHREPGNEGDFVLLAVLQHWLVLAIEKVVAILHANDGCCLASSLNLFYRDLREPDVPDLAFFLRVLQCAQALFNGHLRIDPMELIQIDSLHA